jgi:hypothetical protein
MMTEKEKLENAMAMLKAATAGPNSDIKALRIKLAKRKVAKAKAASDKANAALAKATKPGFLKRMLGDDRTTQLEKANTGVKSDRQKLAAKRKG